MDKARSTISKIFNGEPHSYTRFNLTQNMESDNSQVEMKLSADVEEEAGGNGVGDHLNHNSRGKPFVAPKRGCTPKNLCFLAATVLLIFIIGYLLGYLVHRRRPIASNCPNCVLTFESSVPHETGAAPLMDWDDVKSLLAENLDLSNFRESSRYFSSEGHRAGSSGDEILGTKVMGRFSEFGMKTWTDEHYIKVQDAPKSGSNKIVFKNDQEERPDGFLSYSANGKVTGAVLYAYYGEENDFKLLRDKHIDLNNRVMLIRAGRISFAAKVANAAKVNASAVLIYPDPNEPTSRDNIQLFGHVHMGSGDPYTPGFPSFNHTQFPPIQSSGLPKIMAQTITKSMASRILSQLAGPSAPFEWTSFHRLGDRNDTITVEVNNVLTEKKIHNVFGVIRGFVDPDRYVILGAKRDAWGPGFASSTVGTSTLVELARVISNMVENGGFKPRRSIIFASWSAGEYGSVGATEWLEGYFTSLSMKAYTYIDLDGIVTGRREFKVSASPLLHALIESTLKEIKMPSSDISLLSNFGKSNWETNILEMMRIDNAAYPFLAASGIPSISFRFTSGNSDYKYFGTMQDTEEELITATSGQHLQLAKVAARFAGHIVLRLVHDHLLNMDLMKYNKVVRSHVVKINQRVQAVIRMQSQRIPKSLTVQWLISASGSYSRAARSLMSDIENSNLEDITMCRIINDRFMTVERNFLSPYVSPREIPFRHILMGSGPHTLDGLSKHLEAFQVDHPEADADKFLNQFALTTWTIQGCANSLAGDIWSLDNEI